MNDKIQKLTVWTRHDATARSDMKIRRLIARFGYEGYGRYWAIVEQLMATGGSPYALDIMPGNASVLAEDLKCTVEAFTEFIEYCASKEGGLFRLSGTILDCPSLERRMADRERVLDHRREAAQNAVSKRWEFKKKVEGLEWWSRFVARFRELYPASIKSYINDPQIERELFFATLTDGAPDPELAKKILEGTAVFATKIEERNKNDMDYVIVSAAKWIKARGWMEGAA